MSPLNLLLLGTVGAAVYFYVQGLRVRELAIGATHHYCKRNNLQLLDQSVHLKKVGLGQLNGPSIRRQYNFEFSTTGDERYRGQITMLGSRVDSIWVPAHRLPDEAARAPTESDTFL